MRAVMQTGIKYFAISLESKNSFDSRYSSRKPLIMADAHDFQHITDAQTLAKFCKEAAGSRYIGFDTEFVSENCFRPQLCLIQVSTESDYAIIDTLAIDNIDVFWKMLCEGNHITMITRRPMGIWYIRRLEKPSTRARRAPIGVSGR